MRTPVVGLCFTVFYGLVGCGDGNVTATDTAATDTAATDTAITEGSETETGAVMPEPTATGLLTLQSRQTASETLTSLDQAFAGNEMVALALRVDHQANAETVDLTIPVSTAYIFGNPNLGTPLIAENPMAGLDLPLRMLAWEDTEGGVFVSYDSPATLKQRYGLATVDQQLMLAASALADFASAGANVTIDPTEGSSNIELNEGITVAASPVDASTTFDQLVEAIGANPTLNIAPNGIIDHQANAESVGLSLPFVSVVVFGNPLVGTPLIEGSLTIGLDLPLKMAVVEVEGEVRVIYNDPTFLAVKHGGLEGHAERLAMVTAALEGLAAAATAM